MHNIEFKTEDNIYLRGSFYSPKKTPAPGIILTPGFSALKEHFLAQFAEYFVSLGFCTLLYDHRNFGASDGRIRLEVDPWQQVSDMKDAITFLQTRKEVEQDKIGLWGTSFSAGHVLMMASDDARVKAGVLQAPFVVGHHLSLQEKKPEIFAALQKKYAMDAKIRMQKGRPMFTPVVTNDPEKSAIMKEREAYDFFTSVPTWENKVTLHSIENSGNYYPIQQIPNIQHTPLLYIVANNDTICKTEDALNAFAKTSSSKHLLMIEGHHFSPFYEQFEICSRNAGEWFLAHLK
jgi:pimeloyl-ACP methyl ester carboxylesterase